MTPKEVDISAMVADVPQAVRRLHFLWTALFAGNVVFFALVAGAIEPSPGAAVDARLPQLTSLLSGCGGLVAVAGIIVRAQLNRAAFESARSVRQYILARFRSMLIGVGMAQVWPIMGVVLRERGASMVVVVVTLIGGAVGCLFHFPFTSDIRRDAERIARRLAGQSAYGGGG